MKIQANESIKKIKNPSTKEFSEFWKQYQPFLIEDVAKYWDACNVWTNDYLTKHCGNNIVNIQFYRKDYFDDYKNFAHEDGGKQPIKKMKYEEYLKDYIEKRDKNNNDDDDLVGCYLRNVVFEKYFPDITRDVTYPQYFNGKPSVNYYHGFSNKNYTATSVLHFDAFHNIFAQIRGRKQILLFPPSNYLSFYPPLEDSLGLADFSKVNPERPNLELFPKFPWQKKIEVVLQPGEILYIPPFWWHYVTALDENISLSFFYDFKIQDLFKQKNLLSVILNIAPYYLYHTISSPDGLRNSIATIKSLISLGSFTESIEEE